MQIVRFFEGLGVAFIAGGGSVSTLKDAEDLRRVAIMNFQTTRIAAFGSTSSHKNTCDTDPNIRALLSVETLVNDVGRQSSVLYIEQVHEPNESKFSHNMAMW